MKQRLKEDLIAKRNTSRDPDVLWFGSTNEKLFALTTYFISPIAMLAVINPRALNAFHAHVFDVLAANE
jgi:hypothetical protein